MFKIKNNKLYCENLSIDKIVQKTGTPVFVYSKSILKNNFLKYKNAYSEIKHIICFAVKANTNGTLCRTLFNLGAGADVTSGGELYRALKAGADNNKIVFAGVGKSYEEIEYAIKENILMFNVESEGELKLLDKIAEKNKKKVRTALRINPNIDPHTHKYISTGKKETKFGISIHDSIKIYLNKKKYKNIDLCGIHCHIGSQIVTAEPFIMMAKKLNEIFLYLKNKGINLKYINIGGGLGIRYRDETPPEPEELAKEILPYFNNFNITLILEPGRSIAGSACILVTKILYNKKGQTKNFYIVDAGMSDIIRPTLYGAYHEIVPVHTGSKRKNIFDVVGPICETGDFLGKDRVLPELEPGNLLAVKNAGAYCFSMSSQYNSRCRAPEVMVDGNKWYLIRRRENYSDLVLTETK